MSRESSCAGSQEDDAQPVAMDDDLDEKAADSAARALDEMHLQQMDVDASPNELRWVQQDNIVRM